MLRQWCCLYGKAYSGRFWYCLFPLKAHGSKFVRSLHNKTEWTQREHFNLTTRPVEGRFCWTDESDGVTLSHNKHTHIKILKTKTVNYYAKPCMRHTRWVPVPIRRAKLTPDIVFPEHSNFALLNHHLSKLNTLSAQIKMSLVFIMVEYILTTPLSQRLPKQQLETTLPLEQL